MIRMLVRNWWMVLLQGLLTIGLGIAAFAWPGLTVAVLMTLLAIYMLIEGVPAVFAAIKGERGWWYAVGGVVSILAGLLLLFKPALSTVAIVIVVGAWAFAKGVAEIVAAIHVRKEIEGELWLILSGLVSVAFGLFLIFRPAGGILAILWLIGLFAILKGILLVLLSFKLKGLQGRFAEAREAI